MPSKRTPKLTPEKLHAAIEFARNAGANAATDRDSESGVDHDQHRIRSLMNFERDVVMSTADDTHAIPQWAAFLDAYDAQSETLSGTPASKSKNPAPCIASLRIAFEGTFDESQIPSDKTRIPLNKVRRAFAGLTAIAQILYANETERDAHGEDAEALDIKTVYGLFEALTFLSDGGNANASDLGHHLMRQAKGDA